MNLVATFRVANGLPALIPSAILMQSARDWATWMAENDYFAHDGPGGTTHTSRAHLWGYPSDAWVGGNILYGQPDADAAFNAWKNSPPHRDNMLSPAYKEIGVALGVEPTWDFQGDVYLAASMELGTGQSEPAEVCGSDPPAPAPVRPPRPPKAHLPKAKPPRPPKRRRKQHGIKRILRQIVNRRR